ncbi:MAG: hypothetical protein WCA94_17765 [Candidatus Acidiferrum sp.]
MAIVDMAPGQTNGYLLLQGANKRHKILNLLRLQAFSVGRHFAFAIGNDSREFVIGLLLDILGTQIPNFVRLADAGIGLAIRTMADRAFRFEKGRAAGLSLGRRQEKAKCRKKQKNQNFRANTPSVSIHSSSWTD